MPLRLRIEIAALPSRIVSSRSELGYVGVMPRIWLPRTMLVPCSPSWSGLVGASYLLQALQAAALHEQALIIASAVDEPSLGYMVRTAYGCHALHGRTLAPRRR